MSFVISLSSILQLSFLPPIRNAANASFCHSNRAASILIIAAGTMYYTWVKSVESAQPRPSVPPRDPIDLEKAESALAKHAAETSSSGLQK